MSMPRVRQRKKPAGGGLLTANLPTPSQAPSTTTLTLSDSDSDHTPIPALIPSTSQTVILNGQISRPYEPPTKLEDEEGEGVDGRPKKRQKKEAPGVAAIKKQQKGGVKERKKPEGVFVGEVEFPPHFVKLEKTFMVCRRMSKAPAN